MSASDRVSIPADFPSHLKAIKQLGRGAYGTVYLCEDRQTRGQVAVKHVRQAARHGKSMIREIRLLARLRHENLLHLIDFPAVPSPDFEDIFLVLPYMAADLHKIIQSKQELSEKHVQVIMVQLLRALEYIHTAGVAHRDLKPANILISQDVKVKICDFGLARGGLGLDGDEQEEQLGVLTEYVITRWYRAPEVMLLPRQYSFAVDLWSVGCILAEIVGRKALFPGKDHIDMIKRVNHILGSPHDNELEWLPKDCDAYRFLRKVCPQSPGAQLSTLFPRTCPSPPCLSLMAAMLRWSPKERLSATDAQKHEYLQVYWKSSRAQPEPFDWTFDDFRPTHEVVKERLYHECSRYHPEILERDRERRLSAASRGAGYPSARAQAPRAAQAAHEGYPSARAQVPPATQATHEAHMLRMPKQVESHLPAYQHQPPQLPATMRQQHELLQQQARAQVPVQHQASAVTRTLTPRGGASAAAAAAGMAAPRQVITPRRANAPVVRS